MAFSSGLPEIIFKEVSFSCFGGFVKGTVQGSVCDQGDNSFPTYIKVNTNLGGGNITVVLSGNEVIQQKVNDIKIEINISEWHCNDRELSFRVKAVAKKKIAFVEVPCTVIDEIFSGNRHNARSFELEMERIFKTFETEMAEA